MTPISPESPFLFSFGCAISFCSGHPFAQAVPTLCLRRQASVIPPSAGLSLFPVSRPDKDGVPIRRTRPCRPFFLRHPPQAGCAERFYGMSLLPLPPRSRTARSPRPEVLPGCLAGTCHALVPAADRSFRISEPATNCLASNFPRLFSPEVIHHYSVAKIVCRRDRPCGP